MKVVGPLSVYVFVYDLVTAITDCHSDPPFVNNR